MPLVLLLAGTVAVTPECGGLSDDCCDIILVCLVLLHVRADLLVDGLLELLVVEDGSHFALGEKDVILFSKNYITAENLYHYYCSPRMELSLQQWTHKYLPCYILK